MQVGNVLNSHRRIMQPHQPLMHLIAHIFNRVRIAPGSIPSNLTWPIFIQTNKIKKKSFSSILTPTSAFSFSHYPCPSPPSLSASALSLLLTPPPQRIPLCLPLFLSALPVLPYFWLACSSSPSTHSLPLSSSPCLYPLSSLHLCTPHALSISPLCSLSFCLLIHPRSPISFQLLPSPCGKRAKNAKEYA